MEVPHEIHKEIEYVMTRNWFGDIVLTFQAGRLVLIKKSEVIKPQSVSVPRNGESYRGNNH
jgi:hypothetical protein